MNAFFVPPFSSSILGIAARRFFRRIGKVLDLPVDFEVGLNTTERPPYAYCVYHAADLAKRLGLQAMSVVEFGVAGGNGLLFLERFAAKVERRFGIKIEIYGFDTGRGLPEVAAPEDLPYWFQGSQYAMDVPTLQKRLRRAKLVLGDVRETVQDFFERYQPAPIGALFNDLDLYSSTADSLRLFSADVVNFLPRLFTYFDDVTGSEIEMYSQCNGELLALSRFNESQNDIFIGLNQNLLYRHDLRWRHSIYYAHLKHHPLYSRYVGNDEQQRLGEALKLETK